MKLPHVRRPAASRHSEGGLTPKNPKESAGVVDRKKEFESMVNGIIAEEAQAEGYSDPKGSEYCENNGDYGYGYGDYRCTSYGGESGDRNSLNSSPSVSNNSTSGSVSSSTTSTASSSDGDQNSLTGNKDEGETNNNEAQKDVQEKEEKDGKEKGEKQLNEQKSHENSNGQETNNSSDDAENEKAPSSGNSALLCGSYSSVLLVAVACLCAFAY
ncbi:hypothetical protein, conserved in T. vivax, (fragment) [Trypanosoma vivax Y486]|uniref:Uncharacterized protein n=1 Tax=Trypanosoma vivax (strain Y486) TaxID=1055687 RepID=F9WN16_TRYVY